MSKSVVAAEKIAMEGEQSSPDTQRLRTIFKEATGEDFESAQNVNEANFPVNYEEVDVDSSIEASVSHDTHPELFQSYSHIGHFIKFDEDAEQTVVGQLVNEETCKAPIDAAATNGTSTEFKHITTTLRRDENGNLRLVPIAQPSPSSSTFVVPPLPQHCVQVIQRQTWNFSAITNTAGAAYRRNKMENYSPRSSCSGYSTTQENDPENVRMRMEAATAISRPLGDKSAMEEDLLTRGESSKTGAIEKSYDMGDTGHLTLNYEIPAGLTRENDDDDDEHMEDESQGVDLGPRHTNIYSDPRTPAPRAMFDHPGTVMRPSQLFATTQPSSTIRGPLGDDLNTSRPSPDLFNIHLQATHMESSPLLRRAGSHDASNSRGHYITSSPYHSQDDNDKEVEPDGVQEDNEPDHSSDKTTPPTNIRPQSSFLAGPLERTVPEPHERYISRRESQERRLRAGSSRDDDPESSDDEFGDSEADRVRLAKLKKEAAAKELISIGATRSSGSARSGVVEVPSTEKRRRSIQEDYVAQCTGEDARDTQEDSFADSQPDERIADSQVMPKEALETDDTNSQLVPEEDALIECVLHTSSVAQDDLAVPKRNDADTPDQLPGLEAATASSASTTDREASYSSPYKAPATQALSEVSGNRNETGTPLHKSLLLTKDDELVPETSPLAASQRHYISLGVESQPIASGDGDGDEVYNPFSQDLDFDATMNLGRSPSPLPAAKESRRRFKTAEPAKFLEKFKSPFLAKLGESSKTSSMSSRTEKKELHTLMPAIETLSSEYMTAPEAFAAGSLFSGQQNQTANADDHVHNVVMTDGPERAEAEFNERHLDEADGREEGNGEQIDAANDEDQDDAENDDTGHSTSHTIANPPRQLRTGSMLKGPSRLLRRSGRVPETPTAKTPAARSARIIVASSRSSRRVSGKAPEALIEIASPAQVPPTSTARAAKSSRSVSTNHKKASPTSHLSSRRPSTSHSEPPHDLRPPSRRSSVDGTVSDQGQQFSTPNISRRRRTGIAIETNMGLFQRMAFSVSYGAQDDEKQRVVRHIHQNGGRILENGFDELFNESVSGITSPGKATESGPAASNLTLNAGARDIGFTCVIADKHSRRAKYMQALALGLPCISGKWIEHCVAQNTLLDWSPYMLAAGESSFLGGAIRSRSLAPYSAATASFEDLFGSRLLLLAGKSILLVMGKKKQEEERKKAYLFLTHVLGAKRVKRVASNQEARKVLLESESKGETWDWVYVDNKEEDADKAIFGTAANRKRKRSVANDDTEEQPPKRVKLVNDEFVVQSLILGKLLEVD